MLKQVKASKDTPPPARAWRRIATLPLGTNRSLHLVRAGREIVLLGVAEHGVTPIRRYSEAEARALGPARRRRRPATLPMRADAGEPRAGRRSPRASSNALRSKTVVK